MRTVRPEAHAQVVENTTLIRCVRVSSESERCVRTDLEFKQRKRGLSWAFVGADRDPSRKRRR